MIDKLFNKLFGKMKTSDEIFKKVISREVFYIPRLIQKHIVDSKGNMITFENKQDEILGVIPVFNSLKALQKLFPTVEYEKLVWRKNNDEK